MGGLDRRCPGFMCFCEDSNLQALLYGRNLSWLRPKLRLLRGGNYNQLKWRVGICSARGSSPGAHHVIKTKLRARNPSPELYFQ